MTNPRTASPWIAIARHLARDEAGRELAAELCVFYLWNYDHEGQPVEAVTSFPTPPATFPRMTGRKASEAAE
jgi:hypothetical protein